MKSSQGADADSTRVRALAAYKDFLTLWKNADADILIYKQAKAKVAKLQESSAPLAKYPEIVFERITGHPEVDRWQCWRD
ncbi:MAG TPA: hypothetical protein VFU86_22505 [Terriglobales bacterium]|nr:hypothetical protein [Terriglobales bacterium]